MLQDNIEYFPLSKKKYLKGTRRIAREKVMQIIAAHRVSRQPIEELFPHIFYREFNFDGGDIKVEKLMNPEQVMELEADVPLKWNDDLIKFGRELLESTLKNTEIIDQMIDKFAKNWDLERIANVDRILLQIAATEFMDFHEIPPKVTINEALDISKKYSTSKSRSFINGILDSMLIKLRKEGNLNKEGRGLNEG